MRRPRDSRHRRRATLVLALTGIIAAACSKSVTAPLPAAPANVITGIVDGVYLPTLDSIAVRAAMLDTALDALAAAPTNGTLTAAQDAWRAVRKWYERNEGFPFGPLETEGFDPARDTWPVDVAGIDSLLAGGDTR